MDDGKVNVVSHEFVDNMSASLDRAVAEGAGAVILKGREGIFSAGFDLEEFKKGREARLRLAICADALGAMESLNAQTLEYCKNRKQFGVAIGTFQALQHRMVDMFGACENVKSLLYRATCTADAGDDDARRSLLALKVMVGRAGRLIGGEAIQMHGGMGVSNELPVGHYVKRLMVINTLFGDADYHQQLLADLVNSASSENGAGKSLAA